MEMNRCLYSDYDWLDISSSKNLYWVKWNKRLAVVVTFITEAKSACPWLPSSTGFTLTLCTLKSFLFSQTSALADMLSLALRQALRVSMFIL